MFESVVSTPFGIDVTINYLQNVISQSPRSLRGNEETIMLMYSTLAANVATNNETDQV